MARRGSAKVVDNLELISDELSSVVVKMHALARGMEDICDGSQHIIEVTSRWSSCWGYERDVHSSNDIRGERGNTTEEGICE